MKLLIILKLFYFIKFSAVDEQNQQTSEAIAQCAAAVCTNINIPTQTTATTTSAAPNNAPICGGGVKQTLSHILDDLPETIIDSDEKDDEVLLNNLCFVSLLPTDRLRPFGVDHGKTMASLLIKEVKQALLDTVRHKFISF